MPQQGEGGLAVPVEIGGLTEQRDEAVGRNADAPRIQARLRDAERRLAEETFGAGERTALQAVERRIEALCAGREEYERVQAQLREAAGRQVERRHARLEEAERVRAHGAEVA